MNRLPPYVEKLRNKPIRRVCLIVEGYEEMLYFQRLIELSVFSSRYNIKLINAKGASNIPAIYQDAYASNSYSVVLVVCDRDRKPRAFEEVEKGMDEILGNGKSVYVITYVRPCTLQVIFFHFGDVVLTTQSKVVASDDVEHLTGVKNYKANLDQIKEICAKISLTNCNSMLKRLQQLSKNPKDMPSSNMLILFERLQSDDVTWINEVNDAISGSKDIY